MLHRIATVTPKAPAAQVGVIATYVKLMRRQQSGARQAKMARLKRKLLVSKMTHFEFTSAMLSLDGQALRAARADRAETARIHA